MTAKLTWLVFLLIARMVVSQTVPCEPSTFRPRSEELVFAGFKLGKNTLDDVRQRWGAVTQFKVKHEEEADEFICYVPAHSKSLVVFFLTGSQGGWKELTGYKLALGSQIPATTLKKCAASSKVTKHLSGFRGLRLGSTVKEANCFLGSPEKKGNKLVYEITYHVDDPKQPYDVYDALELTIYNSKVVELSFVHLPAT